MTGMEQLHRIYDEYEEKLQSLNPGIAEVLNISADPRKDAYGREFAAGIAQWMEQFQPGSSGETAEAISWILEYPAAHRNGRSYWMTYAVQKEILPLIPRLSASQAGTIRTAFTAAYPRREWLPVQKQIDAALRAQAGQAAGAGVLRTWAPRVTALLVGLTIAHLGVSLFLLADLGSDPFNVLIQGLHRVQPWAITHGNVHVAVSLLIILALLVIDRSYVRIGTFLCMILGGPIIDLFTLALQGVVNAQSALWIRLAAVVLGCGILAFGMTIVIKSEAGTGPNDLVAVVISDKRRWKFGVVRITVDMAFALTGFFLGGTLGLGTVICVAVVGPVAQLLLPLSEKILKRAQIKRSF